MTEQTQPTDAEILDAADDFRSQYKHGGTTFDEFDALGFARAVLAKWGTPAGVGEPYGYVYTTQVAPIVGDERKVERTVFTRNKPPCNALALYTTPQPTQAQAGAVPLTVDEVEQLIAQWSYEVHGDRARYLVRMTEQHHGIKGKETGNAD